MPVVRLGSLRLRLDGRRKGVGRDEEAMREARKMTARKVGSISGKVNNSSDAHCTREVVA